MKQISVAILLSIAALPAYGSPTTAPQSVPERAPAAPGDQPTAGSPTVVEPADRASAPPEAGEPDGKKQEGDPVPVPVPDEEEIIEIKASVRPGSDHSLGKVDLERFEDDDIHEILAAVPGVYFREEDGFGLRPNIGMRGSNPERSAKIALMEDGILIAPAPYSAPAAYYFPLVTRMQAVEVVKGPGAVLFGPNTVGGSVNLVSSDIPASGHTGFVDMAGGGTLYGKLHGRYGFGTETAGLLIEGARIQSSGFKRIDGGGDTGFAKDDFLAKARLSTSASADVYHALHLTLGYADETSNETYTGLSRADLAASPNRRYRATALDKMQWDHLRWQLTHRVEVGASFNVTTTIYRNSFDRSWYKLNRFRGESDLNAVLDDPTAGNNAIFYAILTGQADTTTSAEELLIGENARTFVSQGLQSVFRTERKGWPGDHNVTAGVRLHKDEAERLHTEDAYAMLGGELVRTGAERMTNTDSLASARALALFAQDKVGIGPVQVTAGSRFELVGNSYEDRLMPTVDNDRSYGVWIPGAGAYWQANPWLGVLAGAHRGFVPVAPGADTNVSPETSINYETGVRLARWGMNAEAIGFMNDYGNLKGTCTFSSGCRDTAVGSEFNGGKVRTYGLETLVQAEPAVGTLGRWHLKVPLRIAYTLTDSRFQTDFSSSFPQWGEVSSGDSLPYIAMHQLTTRAGISSETWQLNAQLRYHSQMRDMAGQGAVAPGERIPGYMVVDLAATYGFGHWGSAYATVDNVFNNRYVVSLRPYGARPGKPRLVVFGYKNGF